MENLSNEKMNIVIVGHVDHGKSTVIGRMLADTNSLPEGKLEQVRANCERNSKPFEYAFLLDALKDEQAQGITIDMARCFFKSSKRNYIILDAPGHIEFLKNMVTGAARAEAAILVIDAFEGIQENSKRHGYLLSMLGIKQVIVCVNKMDLVNYDENVFDKIVTAYSKFLASLEIEAKNYIPVSAMNGDNIASISENMPWYKEMHILEGLDSFTKEEELENQPFRMFLQDVYKFTNEGDDRRICSGRVETGKLNVGDEVIFLPSNKKTTVKTIEGFNEAKTETVYPGKSVGFTVTEQIYVQRGELICKTTDLMPNVSTLIRANIFWMGKQPMHQGKQYFIKIGTAKVPVTLKKINASIDTDQNLEVTAKDKIERHDVVDCVLETSKAVVFDLSRDIEQTSRFVIVDNYEISGGGILRECLKDESSDYRAETLKREIKFERGEIQPLQRSENYGQKATMIIITGNEGSGQKQLAKELEKKLFEAGRFVYYLGIGNVKYGVDTDIVSVGENREEHLRRLSEISYLMLDSGLIVVATARDLDHYELSSVKTIISPFELLTVKIDDKFGSDDEGIIHLEESFDNNSAITKIISWLRENRMIFSL